MSRVAVRLEAIDIEIANGRSENATAVREIVPEEPRRIEDLELLVLRALDRSATRFGDGCLSIGSSET